MRALDVVLSGPSGRVERLTATLDHPFARLGAAGATWTEAGALSAGDAVVSGTSSARVVSVERRETRTEVYNVEVERAHAYFVGLEPVLVHNGTCGYRADFVKARPDMPSSWQVHHSLRRAKRTTPPRSAVSRAST